MAKKLSSGEARTFLVEGPVRDEKLHSHSVVACAEPVLPIKSVRRLDRGAIYLNAEAGTFWNRNLAIPDLQGLFCQCLAVLPDPMGVDRGHFAGRSRSDVSEHGE